MKLENIGKVEENIRILKNLSGIRSLIIGRTHLENNEAQVLADFIVGSTKVRNAMLDALDEFEDFLKNQLTTENFN